MKKRLLFFQLCMMFAGSILQASMPLQYATLSKIYNEPFIPQVEQSAQLGVFGTLDQTLNNDQNSLGSINLSLQLATGSSRAVVALPHDNFLVAISDDANHSIIGMYNAQGTLQTSLYGALSNTPGTVNLGTAPYAQSMILDAQGRAIVCGGSNSIYSGWLQRVQADGSGRTILVGSGVIPINPWFNIAAIATQSDGKIIATGFNGTYGMIGRYAIDGSLDTSFGNNGYVIFDGSSSLPTSPADIYSVVVDSNDKLYIPYVDADQNVWVTRLTSNGATDTTWQTTFPTGAMTLEVQPYVLTGSLQATSLTTADFISQDLMPAYNNAGTFTPSGQSSVYYTGGLRSTGNNSAFFTLYSGSFPSVGQMDYLFGATPDQIRIACDQNNNIIIAAQVGNFIKVTGITSTGSAINGFTNFTSSIITTDPLNISSLVVTADNSILIAGNNATTGQLSVIALVGSGSIDAGQLDTSCNQTGFNFFQSNNQSTGGEIYGICLAQDGRIYAANNQLVGSISTPYISRLYNKSFDKQVAQFPSTQEQGIIDLSFAQDQKQTYAGFLNPYCGNYRGNLQQQGKSIIQCLYAMQNGDNSGLGDFLVATNGLLNNSNNSTMILNWITEQGSLDTDFGGSNSGQLIFSNLTNGNETVQSIAQSTDGSIYLAGSSSIASGVGLLRKYTNLSTYGWTTGSSAWDVICNPYENSQGNYVALQGTSRALVFGGSDVNQGFIVAYDQTTGNLANGQLGASVFGDGGNGYINYNSYGLSMNNLYSAVINNAGDIFIAYENDLSGAVHVAAFFPDGSGLIPQFGTQGVVSNVFTPALVDNQSIRIAQAALTGNLLICAADANYVYVTRLDAVTGQLDRLFNSESQTPGMIAIPLSGAQVNQIQSVSDYSTIITGSCADNNQMFIIRLNAYGQIDTTFNPQGNQPGYEFIAMAQSPASCAINAVTIEYYFGSIVATGYESLTSYDATPFVNRSFGQFGTMAVNNYPLVETYPGTLDTQFNNSGALHLAQLISSGTAKIVYAYPSGNQYQGMLLLAVDNGITTVIARMDETYGFLDQTFGTDGIYTITPNLTGLQCLLVDAQNNIIVAGSNGSGWAQQISADGQGSISFDLFVTINQINGIGQQQSGRYIFACNNGIILAYQNQLVDDNQTLRLDPTFNPLATGASQGAYIVSAISGGLYNLVIANDDTMITGLYDSNQNLVCVVKILANGSGLDTNFGTNGIVTTAINTFDPTSIRVAVDSYNNVIVAAATWVDSTSNAVAAARYDAAGGTSTAFTGAGVVQGVQYIAVAASNAINLSTMLQTQQQQTILLGQSLDPTPLLYAIRLDATGGLDQTWNPYATYPDVPGVLSYSVASVDTTNNACIGISGNIWIAGTSHDGQAAPVLIEINGDTYVQQVAQSPLAAPSGTLDYTLDPLGALNLNTQLYSNIGTPRQVEILSDQSIVMSSQNNGVTYVTKLNPLLQLDTSFNGLHSPGYVAINNAQIVNDMFIANAPGQDGSIYVTGYNENDTRLMWAGKINADGRLLISSTVLTDINNATAIRLGSSGQVLVAGYNNADGTGIIGACTGNLSAIDQSFGENGYYRTGISSPINAMTVDSHGRIYIAYKHDNRTLYVQRILSNGQGVDTSFNAHISNHVCDYYQIDLVLDEANNQLGIINYAYGNLYVNRVSTIDGSGTSGGEVTIGFPYERLTLSNSFIDSDQNMYVIGFNSQNIVESSVGYQTVIARCKSINPTLIALDTSYAPTSDTPGIVNLQAGPLTGVGGFSIGSGFLDQDGRVYVVGQSGDQVPYMARFFGDNYDQELSSAVEFAPDVQPVPEPINSKFGIAYTQLIEQLVQGGTSVVDSLQRVVVAGRTLDNNGFVVARFLQDGALDPAFNGTGLAQTPVLDNLVAGCSVCVDIVDNVYVAGVTSDNACIVAKFLGVTGLLDTNFNHDGVITEIPGIAQSYQINNLIAGGYVTIDYLGNILVGAMTSNNNLAITRFLSDGTIDSGFGQVIPGISTVFIPNLLFGGYVTTDSSIITADNSIYLGASTTDATLLIVKLDRFGNVDTTYASHGIAQTSSIVHLTYGGPVALNHDHKIAIGGSTSDNVFVAARFGIDGFFDPTFNGNGIAYSNPLYILDSCSSICIDSNNNVLLSGTSIGENETSRSMVIARMTAFGAIDTTLSVTGLAGTPALTDLQSGAFVANDALNNIFLGGYNSTQLVVAGLYSGAQIVVENVQSLPAALFKIFWYGNNPNLFKDYLAAEFYAQSIITRPHVASVVLDEINALLDEYALLSAGQTDWNLAACTTPTWDGNFDRLRLILLAAYPDSTDEINQFFIAFNHRRDLVRQNLLQSNN